MAVGFAPLHWRFCVLLSAFAFILGSGFPDLQLLQWNPHWQCFVWNPNNCSAEAAAILPQILQDSDIDFANIIEFEVPNFTLPSNWTGIPSNDSCGIDQVDLIYNNVRWLPSGPSVKGCMAPKDRPFIIQQFTDTNTSEGVIVIGAHFPHPASFTLSTLKEVEVLKIALQSALSTTAVKKVVLIADTNEWRSVSSSRIMKYLEVPAGPIVSTSLETTCCFDNDFASWGAFDRIIANFGAEMVTEVLFDPLPAWAQEFQNVSDPSSRKGAFHKAVKGTLIIEGSGSPTHRTHNIGLITLVVVLVLVGAGVLAFVAYTRYAATRERKQSDESEDDSGSEDDE